MLYQFIMLLAGVRADVDAPANTKQEDADLQQIGSPCEELHCVICGLSMTISTSLKSISSSISQDSSGSVSNRMGLSPMRVPFFKQVSAVERGRCRNFLRRQAGGPGSGCRTLRIMVDGFAILVIQPGLQAGDGEQRIMCRASHRAWF